MTFLLGGEEDVVVAESVLVVVLACWVLRPEIEVSGDWTGFGGREGAAGRRCPFSVPNVDDDDEEVC
jgi:hypothetical protein